MLEIKSNGFFIDKIIEIDCNEEIIIEDVIEQIKSDIKNLENKKFKNLPKEQTIFKDEKDFEQQKNNMIKKWEKELKTVEETEINSVINCVVDNYNFNINDFKCLPKFINEDNYDYLCVNYYIDYNITKDKFYFVISIYDTDVWLDKEISKMLKDIGWGIKVEINTEKEYNMFMKLLMTEIKNLGYNDIQEFIKTEV